MRSILVPLHQHSSKLRWSILGTVLATTFIVGTAAPPAQPLIDLSPEPLYTNGAKTKGNLTLALSVETPTVGQAHRGNNSKKALYVPATVYHGYFDSTLCYRHIPGQNYYDEWKTVGPNGECLGQNNNPGGGFNGNFMNWATASAIDIFRMGLTGGNRVEDVVGKTVLERAWLPDDFYAEEHLFSPRYIALADAYGLVEMSLYNQLKNSGQPGFWIYNCKNRVYFAAEEEVSAAPDCNAPLSHALDLTKQKRHPKLFGPASDDWYEVRVRVCDRQFAAHRLMTYDKNAKKWEGLCFPYGNNNFKPVGQLQMNAESVRVAVFGYLKDDSRARYGGVLRAPLKYLGPQMYDHNFNLLPQLNPEREWDPATGILIAHPHAADPAARGLTVSGAINYINKFGTLGPQANWGQYKKHDPVSELYYEALRYLQGKQPTPQAVQTVGLTSTAAIQAMKDHFPVYDTWTDPFASFQDSPAGPSCLRNSIVAVADTYTHSDRSVPGNTIVPSSPANHGEWSRPPETNPPLDVPFWTKVVGSFESRAAGNGGVTYVDSQGRTQRAENLTGFSRLDPSDGFHPTPSNWLESADSMETGSTGGSYYMAGMAYWANTQSFHPTLPKARVKTYVIDVNERQDSSNKPTFRRTRQLHLAGKYGGFDDNATGQTGNPYTPGTNILWEDPNGDARSYFVASDAQKFLESIADVFSRIAEETNTIAGSAVSTQRVTAAAAGAVFQSRFNPTANFWSGRVLKNRLSVGTGTMTINATADWEAGQVLTAAAKQDHGASRKIVIGPPLGRQGTDLPTAFVWSDLVPGHKKALNSTPTGTTDTLGPLRLSYLRGDQRNEIAAGNPAGYFRPRDVVLGDVVNSGLVYMGKPDATLLGYTDSNNSQAASHASFTTSLANRQKVVFVNANDGMLHAFDDATGAEVFGYIPGFLGEKLNHLPERSYAHMSFADATPAVADVHIRGGWRTALVSGVGGGGQGVYALDVSNPAAFTATSVLWEFTDRDHPAMGNVIGTPQILKFREQPFNATLPHTYKYFAVVASGVNNYAQDGHDHPNGYPSLFFIDLAHDPLRGPWVEGTNYYRIELPQTETTMATGLVSFKGVTDPAIDTVSKIYAGDLQGNLWKLDFATLGIRQMGSSATANFQAFNPIKNDEPLFIAQTLNGTTRQPITAAPEIVHAYEGRHLVAFGTGKFLESSDTSVPMAAADSFYAVLDDPTDVGVNTPPNPPPPQLRLTGRGGLQRGSVTSTTGAVIVPAFTLGTPTTTPSGKAGWFIDFDASIGERHISGVSGAGNRLYFSSLFPTRGSCGDGGGRVYSLEALTGAGYSVESTVGVLAAPLVMSMGMPVAQSGTTGRRTATDRFMVVSQGAKGLNSSNMVDDYSYAAGRMSWRLVNNYPRR